MNENKANINWDIRFFERSGQSADKTEFLILRFLHILLKSKKL